MPEAGVAGIGFARCGVGPEALLTIGDVVAVGRGTIGPDAIGRLRGIAGRVGIAGRAVIAIAVWVVIPIVVSVRAVPGPRGSNGAADDSAGGKSHARTP